MLAAAAIEEGQVLLQVPESLFMTANTAVKSKLCGKLVKSAELPEWQVSTSVSLWELACTGHFSHCMIVSCSITSTHSASQYISMQGCLLLAIAGTGTWQLHLSPASQQAGCTSSSGSVTVLLKAPDVVCLEGTAASSTPADQLPVTSCAATALMQALVLHLLCERAAGPDSFWAPYIAVLGQQVRWQLIEVRPFHRLCLVCAGLARI
jgi:hypothetical protein